jgi:hypothetical protein
MCRCSNGKLSQGEHPPVPDHFFQAKARADSPPLIYRSVCPFFSAGDARTGHTGHCLGIQSDPQHHGANLWTP